VGLLAGLGWRLAAQDPDTMLPEQSAAKARELLNAAIHALGGDAYLHVRDITRVGRLSQFGHSGNLTGFIEVFDFTKLPNKRRREYSKRRNIIDVFNGNEGWSLDREGVEETSAQTLDAFQENLRRGMDNFLRFRYNKEPGVLVRYAGMDLMDMKQIDWVEVSDREHRVIRIALDRGTHLPIRAVNFQRDPETRNPIQEVDYFSNYQPVQGVTTPFRVARDRAGRRISETVYTSIQYNTGLEDSLFTRASLEERWAKIGKKKPAKDK
jgi:outer membrane lipoprotein-sorting protein